MASESKVADLAYGPKDMCGRLGLGVASNARVCVCVCVCARGLLVPNPSTERGVAGILSLSPDGTLMIYPCGSLVIVREVARPERALVCVAASRERLCGGPSNTCLSCLCVCAQLWRALNGCQGTRRGARTHATRCPQANLTCL